MLQSKHSFIVVTRLLFHLWGLIYSSSFVISASNNVGVNKIEVKINFETIDQNSTVKVTTERSTTELVSKDSSLKYKPCQTPIGRNGYCIEILECPELLAQVNKAVNNSKIKKFLLESQCVYEEDSKYPVVCCESGTSAFSFSREIPGNAKSEADVVKNNLHKSEKEECFTPKGHKGRCVKIKSCPSLVDKLNSPEKSYIENLKCDPNDTDTSDPKVCCLRVTAREGEIFPKECGGQRVILNNRITGGTETMPGEFPWMARLVHGENIDKKYFGCSGFLVHQKYVLTAAHCTRNNNPRGPLISVFFGGNDAMSDCLEEGCDRVVNREIKSIVSHPNYDPGRPGPHSDIALIRLRQSIIFSAFVKPICLNRDTIVTPSYYSITGWGKTDTDDESTQKRKAEIPFVNRTECNKRYSLMSVTIEESQICAGGLSGTDSCKGDSGGPLMYVGTDNRWYAAGITSFGVGCGVEGWPGVYTNITYFIPWITDLISNAA